jgi:hypothetical protein
MNEIEGEFFVDGKRLKWLRNPVTGGTTIFLDSTECIQLPGAPDRERAAMALIGYETGRQHGKSLGMRVIQTEFRNLMNLNWPER